MYKWEHAAGALWRPHSSSTVPPPRMAGFCQCYARSVVSVVCSFSFSYMPIVLSVVCSFSQCYVQTPVCVMCSL